MGTKLELLFYENPIDYNCQIHQTVDNLNASCHLGSQIVNFRINSWNLKYPCGVDHMQLCKLVIGLVQRKFGSFISTSHFYRYFGGRSILS